MAQSKALVIIGVLCGSMWLLGCPSHTIIVPPGDPMRLRENVPQVKVWVFDAEGKETPSVADIPAGWFVLPDDFDIGATKPKEKEK